MASFHVVVAVVLSLLTTCCIASKSRMVCETLDDIFEDERGPEISSRSSRGLPGKHGPPGPKGEQGEPGVTNPRDVTRLEQEISRVESETTRKISEQKSKILEIERNYVPRGMLEICDVFFAGKCYALIMSTARMNIEEGKTACRRIQGVPANIYSEEHFEKMRALLRSRIYIGYRYNHIWTGMTVDIPRRTILKSDGTSAPYTRWYPNRPFTPARAHVGIHVESDAKHPNHGMFDENGSYRLLGVLCEI